MEIEQLPKMNLSKLNYYQLLSYTFNELFGKLDSYKCRRYTNLICYNNQFFWLYSILNLDNNYGNCHFTVEELNEAKDKAKMSLKEKIKQYQLSPFNIHRNEYKEILGLDDIYGKYRYGKVEEFYLVDLQKKDIDDVTLKNYEYKYTHYNNFIRIDKELSTSGDNDTNNKRIVRIIFFNKSVVSKKIITQLNVKKIINTYEIIIIIVFVKLIPDCIYKNIGNIKR